MLLTPDMKAVGETLHLAEKVTRDLGLVDGELNDLLAGDPTDLFAQIAQRPKIPSSTACRLPRKLTRTRCRRRWPD